MSYTVRPEEHELKKARSIIESALESCKYRLEKEESLRVNLGASSDENYGAHGLAARSTDAQIYFNPDRPDWEEDLRKTAISSYGNAWFYENVENIGFVWRELLASATGLLLLEEVGEGRDLEKEDLAQEWMEKKSSLGDELSVERQESFSWELKLVLGRKLLEEHDLEEFPGLSFSEVRDAGEEAFE